MLVVSDVHDALDPLRRVVTSGEPILILGDLVNLTDYRRSLEELKDTMFQLLRSENNKPRAKTNYRKAINQ